MSVESLLSKAPDLFSGQRSDRMACRVKEDGDAGNPEKDFRSHSF